VHGKARFMALRVHSAFWHEYAIFRNVRYNVRLQTGLRSLRFTPFMRVSVVTHL